MLSYAIIAGVEKMNPLTVGIFMNDKVVIWCLLLAGPSLGLKKPSVPQKKRRSLGRDAGSFCGRGCSEHRFTALPTESWRNNPAFMFWIAHVIRCFQTCPPHLETNRRNDEEKGVVNDCVIGGRERLFCFISHLTNTGTDGVDFCV